MTEVLDLLEKQGLHLSLGSIKEGGESVCVTHAKAWLAVAAAPTLEDPLRVRIKPQHQARQAHVGRDELETTVLVRAARVLVALLVDFHLHEAVLEAVKHVQRAAARHGAVPHKLRGALAQPREAPLQLGQDEVLLADLEFGALRVLGGEAAPAEILVGRAFVAGPRKSSVGIFTPRLSASFAFEPSCTKPAEVSVALCKFLAFRRRALPGTDTSVSMAPPTLLQGECLTRSTRCWVETPPSDNASMSMAPAPYLNELLTRSTWRWVEAPRPTATVLPAPAIPHGLLAAGPFRRWLDAKVFRHGSHIS